MARGSIRKRGKYYHIVYRDSEGRQREKSIGTNKKEAERALTEVMRKIHRGEYQELPDIELSEFARRWLSEYAKGTVRPSTFKQYSGMIKTHIIPYFGNARLKNLRGETIQGFVSYLLQRRKPKTALNVFMILREILSYAESWGYILKNPARGVRRPQVPGREMDFLQPEEIKLLLDSATGKYRVLLITAVFTGMRQGELLALKWNDIDWISSTVHVRRSLYKGKFYEPKTLSAKRTINMPPVLIQELRKHRLASLPSEFVFCSRKGTPIDATVMLKLGFHPALRRSGLRGIRFHDLRHTYAALLINQGENIKYIQHQLGHSSAQITLDRYGHLMRYTHDDATGRLEKTAGKILAKDFDWRADSK